ncbi:MAG: hypothetical protein JW861_12015 [Bacteroidales bacterium]|nr:hypothetical protein [Bacteroidales bacterium]
MEGKPNPYLPCDHCGHLNPLSEYLIFCNRCGKKLGINYQAWVRDHPGGSFVDFAARYGVLPGEGKKESPGQAWFRRKPSGMAGLAIIAAALLITVILVMGMTDIPDILRRALYKDLSQLTSQEWNRVMLDDFGMSFKSPITLKTKKTSWFRIPHDEGSPLLRESQMTGKIGNRYRMEIHCAVFNPETVLVHPEMIKQLILGLRQKRGITSVNFYPEKIHMPGKTGHLCKGSYLYRGRLMRSYLLVITQMNSLWIMHISAVFRDPSGPEIAERVLSSLRITDQEFAGTPEPGNRNPSESTCSSKRAISCEQYGNSPVLLAGNISILR